MTKNAMILVALLTGCGSVTTGAPADELGAAGAPEMPEAGAAGAGGAPAVAQPDAGVAAPAEAGALEVAMEPDAEVPEVAAKPDASCAPCEQRDKCFNLAGPDPGQYSCTSAAGLSVSCASYCGGLHGAARDAAIYDCKTTSFCP
jgi:hypothetical protein